MGAPVVITETSLAWVLAWARVFPTIAIVPAFGLRVLPAPARVLVAVALAAAFVPALGPIANHVDAPWPVLVMEQFAVGLPVALAAAVPLWTATMAGGLVDSLRGSREASRFAGASSFALLLSLFASVVFLSLGGPAHVVSLLARATLPDHPLLAASQTLVSGIGLAVAIGAPVLAGSVVLEVAFALMARAAGPADVRVLVAPLRALGVLALVALLFERIAALLALAVRGP